MKTFRIGQTALLILVCGGCEVPEIEVDTTVATPPAQKSETEATTETAAVVSAPREVKATDPTRGKRSRAAGGYLGAVFGARFYAEHSLIFDSIKHALNLYWGEHGYYPKTHDEFMEKIIRFNQIQLPELDPGVEYLYDPEDHQLKIHKPE